MNIKPLQMAASNRVKIVGQLDGYASEMIKEFSPRIYALSHYNPITIAQKGDLLLVNSGAKTSYLNMKKMEKSTDIMDMISKNVHENSKYNTRSIEYIA